MFGFGSPKRQMGPSPIGARMNQGGIGPSMPPMMSQQSGQMGGMKPPMMNKPPMGDMGPPNPYMKPPMPGPSGEQPMMNQSEYNPYNTWKQMKESNGQAPEAMQPSPQFDGGMGPSPQSLQQIMQMMGRSGPMARMHGGMGGYR